MKTETLSILEKVKSGKLTPEVAQEQLFVLLGIANCFRINANVIITECFYGHEFNIGEEVTIIDHSTFGNAPWLCRDDQGVEWYICEEEGEVVN